MSSKLASSEICPSSKVRATFICPETSSVLLCISLRSNVDTVRTRKMIMKKILITLILCLKMSNFVESKKSNIEDSGSSDNVRGDPTPIFKFVAKDDSLSSHREFGNVIGNTFKDKIVARLSQDSDLANAYEYCVNTSEGKQVYEEFLDAHERVYPKYVEVSFDYETMLLELLSIYLTRAHTHTHTQL